MTWIYTICAVILTLVIVAGQIANIVFCFLSYKERVDVNMFNKRYSDLQDEFTKYRIYAAKLYEENVNLKRSYEGTKVPSEQTE